MGHGWNERCSLVDGDFVVGMKDEVTVIEHAGCKITHDRGRLDVEVLEHFIGSPASKQSDDIRIDLCAE